MSRRTSRRDVLRRVATLGSAAVGAGVLGRGLTLHARVGSSAPLAPLPSSLRSKFARAANRCVAFNLDDIARRFPGEGRIADFGGALEADIRVPAFTAFGLAVLLDTERYDGAQAGVPASWAGRCAVRLIDSLSHAHRANGGTWGAVAPETAPLHPTMATRWQSSLWAWAAGVAAHRLWPVLTGTQRAAVIAMVCGEADRFLEYPVPYWKDRAGRVQYPGDTKSEENSWHAGVLLLAVALDPTGAPSPRRMAKALELAASVAAVPADLDQPALLNGVPVRELVHGTNVEASGIVENHGVAVNPTYMASGPPQIAVAGAVFAQASGLLPAACLHHLDLVYRAMSELRFRSPPFAAPGGTIYRPGRPDIYYPITDEGDPNRTSPFAAFDAIAHNAGADATPVPARIWAARHIARQLDLLDRPDSRQRSNADFAAMTSALLLDDAVTRPRRSRLLQISNDPALDLVAAVSTSGLS